MKIIEIVSLPNGGHRNQEGDFLIIPDGYAIIPDDMETPNFPFGEIETKNEDIVRTEFVDGELVKKVIGTRKVVSKWTPSAIPEPEPTPESEIIPEPSDIDDFASAILEGVNEV